MPALEAAAGEALLKALAARLVSQVPPPSRWPRLFGSPSRREVEQERMQAHHAVTVFLLCAVIDYLRLQPAEIEIVPFLKGKLAIFRSNIPLQKPHASRGLADVAVEIEQFLNGLGPGAGGERIQ